MSQHFFFIPPACHADIRQAFVDSDGDWFRETIVELPTGDMAVGLDVGDFCLIANPEDDRNLMINSTKLVGVIEDLSRDAFLSGFRAAMGERRTVTSDRAAETAWLAFFPGDQLRENINHLFEGN